MLARTPLMSLSNIDHAKTDIPHVTYRSARQHLAQSPECTWAITPKWALISVESRLNGGSPLEDVDPTAPEESQRENVVSLASTPWEQHMTECELLLAFADTSGGCAKCP